MHSICTERTIHTHLKYLETLFDVGRKCKQLEKKNNFSKKDFDNRLSKLGMKAFSELHARTKKFVGSSSFNWISSSFWQAMIVGAKQQQ
jgi:hypothetical protein